MWQQQLHLEFFYLIGSNTIDFWKLLVFFDSGLSNSTHQLASQTNRNRLFDHQLGFNIHLIQTSTLPEDFGTILGYSTNIGTCFIMNPSEDT